MKTSRAFWDTGAIVEIVSNVAEIATPRRSLKPLRVKPPVRIFLRRKTAATSFPV